MVACQIRRLAASMKKTRKGRKVATSRMDTVSQTPLNKRSRTGRDSAMRTGGRPSLLPAKSFYLFFEGWSLRSPACGTAHPRAVARQFGEEQVEAISPEAEKGRPPVRIAESRPVRDLLFSGVGSLYPILLVATFLPSWFSSCWLPSGGSGKPPWDYFPLKTGRASRERFDQVAPCCGSYVAATLWWR